MKDRESQDSTETEPKRPLGYRVGERLRTVRDVGREAATDPKGIPRRTGGWFKRWMGKVWKVRGGGLYAVGYIVCFVYFEIEMFVGEIAGSSGVVDFFRSQLGEFFFRFFTETIQNMIKAFIWPVYVVGINPPYGPIALGLAFWLFPMTLKKPIARWLFGREISGDQERADRV